MQKRAVANGFSVLPGAPSRRADALRTFPQDGNLNAFWGGSFSKEAVKWTGSPIRPLDLGCAHPDKRSSEAELRRGVAVRTQGHRPLAPRGCQEPLHAGTGMQRTVRPPIVCPINSKGLTNGWSCWPVTGTGLAPKDPTTSQWLASVKEGSERGLRLSRALVLSGIGLLVVMQKMCLLGNAAFLELDFIHLRDAIFTASLFSI